MPACCPGPTSNNLLEWAPCFSPCSEQKVDFSGWESGSIKNNQQRDQYYLFKCGTPRGRPGWGKKGNECNASAAGEGCSQPCEESQTSITLERHVNKNSPPLQRCPSDLLSSKLLFSLFLLFITCFCKLASKSFAAWGPSICQ